MTFFFAGREVSPFVEGQPFAEFPVLGFALPRFSDEPFVFRRNAAGGAELVDPDVLSFRRFPAGSRGRLGWCAGGLGRVFGRT